MASAPGQGFRKFKVIFLALKPDGSLPRVLLSTCAIVSLALGLFQDFGMTLHQGEPPVDWVEGVTILVAVLIVVGVGSVNDWQKEKQFEALNEKREDRFVKALRNGREQLIHVHNVVVGDIVLLEPGDVIPCAAMSPARQASRIQKLSYQECIALRDRRFAEFDFDSLVGDGESTSGLRRGNPSGLDLLGHTDCFVISGSRSLKGLVPMIISVRTKSFNGRIMMSSSHVPL